MRNSTKIVVLAFVIIFVGCTEKSKTTTSVSTNQELENIQVATISESIVTFEREVVFIAGYDKGDNSYYTNAKSYFENQDVEIVESALSLQEIILWLNINYNEIPYSKIHIVNNNKLNEMSLETTIKGDKITTVTLENAVGNGTLPILDNVLNADAKLIFHASGLGSNTKLMNDFKQIFTTDIQPIIIASENVSVFGSEFAPQYLAKPYYGFYPTAQSPGRVDLAKQFAKNYPGVEIDWLSVMNNSTERFLGDSYSYKFNVPVRWEIDFHGDDELPSFPTTASLIRWMQNNDEISADLDAIGIPLGKFRWYQTIKDETLIIKGKVTVICVLEPVMDYAYPTQYMVPSIDNLRLYDTL